MKEIPFVTNGSFVSPEKKNISYSKAKSIFCLSLHYDSDNSYLFVTGKEIYKSKASNKNNFPSKFSQGSITNEFNSDNLNEIYFRDNMFDFSIDYITIDKSYILNIHKYLMIKNDI